MDEPEGWGVIRPGDRKAHYYRNMESLCRRVGFYRGPSIPTPSPARTTAQPAGKSSPRPTPDTPPWTVPPSRGRHAATAPRTSLSLVFDTQQGRYRHAETGPMPGLGDVDAMLTAERGWWAR